MRVFVNGGFDVLHIGHIRLLKYAATHGQLTVAINSDASIKKLKGPYRPVNPEAERKEILESFRFVHEVVIFNEPDPTTLLIALFMRGEGPSVVVKGYEYANRPFPERNMLEEHECRILYHEQIPNRSTTRSIQWLRY